VTVARIGFEGRVCGVLHTAAPDAARPGVVIAHGFKGFSGWGMFPPIADALAEAGFAAVRFDFSWNGADGNGDFTRLDLFERNTLTREQEDLAWIVERVCAGFDGRCVPGRVALLGHSRGGGGVIEYGARDPRVRAVVGLAAVARADRFPPEVRAQAERDGSYPVANARTGQLMPVGVDYFRDAPRHDILASARTLGSKLMCIHGTADTSVPIEEGRLLAEAAGTPLVPIEGANHTFGMTHPPGPPTTAFLYLLGVCVRKLRSVM
jgi:pimeloyl-ACP methyl ester carboxylesterase